LRQAFIERTATIGEIPEAAATGRIPPNENFVPTSSGARPESGPVTASRRLSTTSSGSTKSSFSFGSM
jgi:hypothetical protein